MNLVSEKRLISRVSQYRATKMPFRHSRKRAAVAIIFSRGKSGDLEFLMIRRAVAKGDPWSGQMAFPGGRIDPEDTGAYSAVFRESMEELNIELAELRFLGRLSDRLTRKLGRVRPMLITPYVFFTKEKPQTIANYEVASVHWLPFSYFLKNSNRQFSGFRYKRNIVQLPYFSCKGCMVWGLSLAMFDELISVYKTRGEVGRLF